MSSGCSTHLAVRVEEDLRGRALVGVGGVLHNSAHDAERRVAQLREVDLDLHGAVCHRDFHGVIACQVQT